MTDSASAEELRRVLLEEIEEVFPPFPVFDGEVAPHRHAIDICGDPCDECTAVHDSFAGKAWTEISEEAVFAHRDDHFFFSDEAFRVYLPAYLRTALRSPKHAVHDGLLCALEDPESGDREHLERRYSGFDRRQAEFIVRFFEWRLSKKCWSVEDDEEQRVANHWRARIASIDSALGQSTTAFRWDRTLEVESAAIDRTMTVRVTGFGSTPTQHLAVFLDGEFYFDPIGTVSTVRSLVEAGEIPSITLAFVSHVDAAFRHREYVCRTEFVEFLADELLTDLCEAGWTTGDDVLLAGVSLSGLAVLHAAKLRPDSFPRVLAFSPSAWWNDEWLAGQIAAGPDLPIRVFTDVGDEENESGVVHPPGNLEQKVTQRESCRRLADALEGKARAVSFGEYAGGHAMECWRAELPDALRWLYEISES